MDAKQILKKRQKSMIENVTQTKGSEMHGLEVSRNSERKSIKIAMGICPECGAILLRPIPCDSAVHNCRSATEVSLTAVKMFQLEVLLPPDLHRKLKQLAIKRKVGINEAVVYALENRGVEENG